MSMADLEEAIALIERNEDEADFDGDKPEELISKAEQALGLTFPLTYRTFLARLGCGGIAGAEFYGVIKDDFVNSGIPDAIWATLKQRKEFSSPEYYIVVGSTGDGGLYAIDCSASSGGGENPVIEWWPGLNEQKSVADDYGEFSLRTVREAVGEY